jgi:predicted Fe-Mo cluster-binding NifX family protein
MDPERIRWNQIGEKAAERLRERGISKYSSEQYAKELKAVMAEHEAKKLQAAARYEQKNGQGTNGWKIYQSGNKIIEVEVTDSRNLTKLANLVLSLPQKDNAVDVRLAVQVINTHCADLAPLASGDFLNEETLRRMGNKSANDSLRQISFQDTFTQVQRGYPEVAACYRGARMSEQVLKAICAPLFTSPTKQYARRECEVRKYSSDHIHYDASGNQFRTYVR